MKFKNKKILIFISLGLIILLIGIILTIFLYFKYIYTNNLNEKSNNINPRKIIPILNDSINNDEFISNILADTTSNEQKACGRLITILITGLDSRMGTIQNHADANHLLKIWIDSGFIQVISIPRGTFVDLGLVIDSLDNNYLANARSIKGRDRYHKEICRISNIDSVDYFIEFGFSQAIGLLELLGFENNSKQMLQVFRSRKSFGIGDYQRSFNQGMFIRQSIFKQLNKEDNIFEDLAIRAAITLTETNLNFSIVKGILSELRKLKIGKDIANFQIKLMPKLASNVKLFDFYDKNVQNELIDLVNNTSKNLGLDENSYNYNNYLYKKIKDKIKSVEKDSVRNPMNIQKQLNTMYNQKIWLQITAKNQRNEIRDALSYILIKSYENTGNHPIAKKMKESLEIEKKVIK